MYVHNICEKAQETLNREDFYLLIFGKKLKVSYVEASFESLLNKIIVSILITLF